MLISTWILLFHGSIVLLLLCCSVPPPGGQMQDNCGSVASFLRSAASSSGLPRDLDDVTIPDFSDVSGFVHAGGRGCGVSSLPARLSSFSYACPYREAWFHIVFVSEVNLCVDCGDDQLLLWWGLVFEVYFNTSSVLLCFGDFNFWRSFCASHTNYLHVVSYQKKRVPLLNMFMSWEQIRGTCKYCFVVKSSSSEDFGTQLVFASASVCFDCILFVSTGGGQRLSWEGEWIASPNPCYSRWMWCFFKRSFFVSSSGISSSFCLNSRNPHVFRRDFLAERKRRDGYNCRCRVLCTRN